MSEHLLAFSLIFQGAYTHTVALGLRQQFNELVYDFAGVLFCRQHRLWGTDSLTHNNSGELAVVISS